MQIAYLTNQYPKVSHSFIRREITALEQQGVAVARFTMRQVDEPLVDAADEREREKTTALVENKTRLFASVLRNVVTRPLALVRAAHTATTLGMRSERGILRNLGYLAGACVLADELRARGVRHVHAHFGTNPAAVALLCHELAGTSYSFTVHGPEEFDATVSLSLTAKLRSATFAAGVSSFGRSQLRRLLPFEAWDKLEIVRCGVDASYLNATPTPVPESAELVSVGRLCEQKGQLTLVEAVARVSSRGHDVKLTLVGDGPMRAILERRIAELGIADRVHITGWASGDFVRAAIERSRALVLPSYAEGLPLVLMEALALGRPCISTYVAGIPELVEDGKNGWLVPAGAVEPLTDALERCLQTPTDRLTQMGLEGRARVVEQHDASKNAAELRARFERVAG